MKKRSESRATTHQVNIRLTEDQFRLLDEACATMAQSWGQPSIPKFLLTEGLLAAERLVKGKKG